MLMFVDTIAYAQTPFRICSDGASVTMFKFIDLADITATKLTQITASFTNLNAVIFSDYLDHNVSSSPYQQVDLVWPDKTLQFQLAVAGIF